ncbi:MAG: hypothetical protein V9G20_00345 [Candidatus Promineifilaceae bacterium]
MLRRRFPLLAAAFLAVLVLLFFHKTLFPPEGQVLGGYDMRGYYYILPKAVREAVYAGHLPFWDPYRFNGTPFMADPQNEAFYPPAWLMLILPVNVGLSWFMALHVWLAALGMVAFVRSQRGRWTPAVLAGLCFAFGGYLTGRLWAGHTAVYAVTAWTPWMLLALGWAVRRGDWRAGVLAGLPFGLSLLAGHYPSFLYVGLIWGAYLVYLWLTAGADLFPLSSAQRVGDDWQPLRRRVILRQGVVMALVGFGLAMVHLLPFVQFSLATERVAAADYNFATDYSMPPAHLLTLIVPEFFGEPTRLGYWSVQTFEELSYYAGILAWLGLLLALRRPNRFTVFCLVLIVFGLWLALGRYGILYKLAFDWLPPFRLVRAPGRAAFLWLFGVTALLGRLGEKSEQSTVGNEQSTISQSLNHSIFTLRFILVAISVIFAAAIASAGVTFMAIHPTETSGRVWHQINGEALALALFLVGGLLIGKYLSVSREQLVVGSDGGHRWFTVYWTLLTKNWPAAALILLAVADLWTFSWKMVRLEPSASHPLWAEARAIIGATTERVLPWGVPVFEQNGSISVELTSMFGYDSLAPADHLALATSVADPRSTAYDVLGVRYVIAATPLDAFTGEPGPLTLYGQQGETWVYTRPHALPVARLLYAYEVVTETAAAIHRLHQPDFIPAQTAILAEEPACNLEAGTGMATIEANSPGFWRITTQSDAPALLVLAETAYPGWQVMVDGEQAVWQKAYTTLRAVCVPAGEHIVEWHFRPVLFWWGLVVSLLGVGVVVAAAVPLVIVRR